MKRAPPRPGAHPAAPRAHVSQASHPGPARGQGAPQRERGTPAPAPAADQAPRLHVGPATGTGTLYLLPTPLAAGTALATLPPSTVAIARELDYFLAESAKSARAFLNEVGHPRPIAELRIVEIGHHPDPAAVDAWLLPLACGVDAAIVSEAGCPGVADPGAGIVARAQALGLRVRPLVGPSSLLLALMASGLNGQSFRFLGYLPREPAALAARLRTLERDSRRGETQLWIETPYRNERLLDAVLAHCAPDSRLALAIALGAANECVLSLPVAAWRALGAAGRPPLHRHPAVFALLAAPAPT